MNMPKRPVGMFDSGVGGLSVALAIRRLMPDLDLIYVGDARNVPYGGHEQTFIRDRARSIADFLVIRNVSAIVIACNTATAAAASDLRCALSIPVVGMEPAVKPAAAATRSGIVGVLATAGTLASARFAGLLDRFGEGVTVLTEPCPDLVTLVEQGVLEGPETEQRVSAHVGHLIEAGADTLILGCTHFPFLRGVIERQAGPGVSVIDTGPAVARQLFRVLGDEGHGAAAGAGRIETFASGDVAIFSATSRLLWPGLPHARPLPEP
jgi:glutamate racemase